MAAIVIPRRRSFVARGVWLVSTTILALGASGHQLAAGELDFDVLFSDHAGGRVPSKVAWSPAGDELTYVWKTGDANALWIDDLGAKGRRRLLTIGEDGDVGPAPRLAKLGGYHWAPDGTALLLESDGDLYHLALADATLRRLTETDAEEQDPKFSPDGGRVAFVRDWDLHLLDLESGEERRLTHDGVENETLNGTTDWVYWEEIWGRDSTGFWWSPAGDRIAYYRFDESPVKSYPMVDSTHPYPQIEWQKYPAAGEHNPIVRVGVLELASDETTWLDTGADHDVYLARVDWRRSGDRVLVQRLNRDQTELDLLLCDPAGGDCSELMSETSETWVNLTLDLHFLADDSFVWSSEASGWNEVFVCSPGGNVERELTPAEWTVSAVAGLAEKAGRVVVSAYKRGELGALHRAVLSLPLGGGRPVVLAGGEAWSSAAAVASNGRVVISSSTADEPTTVRAVDADGSELAKLPVEGPIFDPTAVPQWKFFTIAGPDGSRLPAGLLEPAGREPGEKYPVIMYHYGGPASQVVSDRWSSRGRGPWHKMMAERGYGVFSVDNQASNYFGKSGADRVHRRFGPINLAAQRAGVDYLRSLDWVDGDRIGIWGWSGGGTHTLYVLFNSPGTWAAGVSGAPVTDWRFYDTIWTERYLDHPEDNPDGYRDSSPVTWVEGLADKLLVVHGTGDDNVHPNNTFALLRRLIDAEKAFEDAIYPRQKHGFRGKDSRHFYERMTEFFDRHLRGGGE